MAIRGGAWFDIKLMGLAVGLGFFGTAALFWGLRFVIWLIVKKQKGDSRLHVFNFRQIQETVICRSLSLAVCSLLILAALCCFGAGTAIAHYYGDSGQHALDYTFAEEESGSGTEKIRKTLAEYHLEDDFSDLFEMKVGLIRTTEDMEHAFQMEELISALEAEKPYRDREILLNNLQYESYPYLISLGSYNRLLSAAGMPELELSADEAAVYMDRDLTEDDRIMMLNNILEGEPKAWLDGRSCRLTGKIQTVNLVTDRSITLSFALIVPDEMHDETYCSCRR